MDGALASFAQRLLPAAPAPLAAWAEALRAQGREQVLRLPAPGVRDEAWRFTDPAPLYRDAPVAVAVPGALAVAAALPEAGQRLVFVDGLFRPELSDAGAQDGVEVVPLAGLDQAPAGLGTLAGAHADLFGALNWAWLGQGALVRVAAGCQVQHPVHLQFLGTAGAACPRVLVVMEPGARATVVEEHAAAGGATLALPVTELLLGRGASLHFVRLVDAGSAGFSVGRCAARLDADARLEVQALGLSGRLSRLQLDVALAGPGAHCSLDGLALAATGGVCDLHSELLHAAPDCSSRQAQRCVADGTGRVVFNGAIRVAPGAQRTDAAQQCRSLLLSPRARVDAKPQLEIFADDVRCAHGATVGQLDEEQLFYLRARGLAAAEARNLLIHAFAAEILRRTPVASLRDRLGRRIASPVTARGS